MPTFNQLVKKGRSDKAYKSKSPVLQKGFNALRNEMTDLAHRRKEEFVQRLRPLPPRSLTQLFVRSPE